MSKHRTGKIPKPNKYGICDACGYRIQKDEIPDMVWNEETKETIKSVLIKN